MEDAKPSKTPMLTNQAEKKRIKDIKTETSLDLTKKIPYREAVGALLYLTNCTRPDISYSVNVLTRKCHNFDLNDWLKVEKVLKYLIHSKDVKLIYRGNDDRLTAYSDASLGINDEEGKSISGYLVQVFGDAVIWGTKRQGQVANSSMEAEYIALNTMCRDVRYITHLCTLITKEEILPIIYEDNSATISAVKSGSSRKLKSLVGLKFKYVVNEYFNKRFEIKWIPSKEQLADIFTKALPRPLFESLRDEIFNLF
ncbi:unnamed protein product [Brugia timori]|uniref:Copia protein n=1 Tax=Brugia timori TaxID=42155 RepID=A0A0R3Q7J1_9BILA|nr:unnamed protein product [Brugia timori]